MTGNFISLYRMRGTISDQYSLTGGSVKEGIMLQVSSLMAFGALCWTVIVLSLGMPRQAIIPIGYIALTTSNLFLCRKTGWKEIGCNIQILASILLPVIFQVLMGGLMSSGMVMQWSGVALGGVLTFVRGKRLYFWLAITLTAIAIAILADPLAQTHFSNPLHIGSKWLFLFNTVLCSISIFLIGIYFLNSVAMAKAALASTNNKLQTTLSELTTKNSELLEGLRYAEYIQNAIFPGKLYLKEIFPRSFRMHRPKDHVSGDFLWVMESNDWKIAACVDCTGHGIPGGLLGMLGYCILNELVYEKRFEDPAELLNAMNKIVVKRLNQKTNTNKDGMEVSLVFFNPRSGELKMASAGGNIMVLRAGDSSIERYRVNRRHIGGQVGNSNASFESQKIKLELGDRVYMLTDGYTDQFGGIHEKKYSRKRFKSLLSETANSSIEEQKVSLIEAFKSWKGSNPQIDDVLVFGFEYWAD